MTSMSRYDNSTLEELERSAWGEPTSASHLVTECHRLRRTQLGLMTAENLRILIGQQIGLPYLVPRALEILKSDPFIAGDFYPGDLLCAVLKASAEHWRTHPSQVAEAREVLLKAQAHLEAHGKVVARAVAEARSVFESAGHGSNKSLERTRDR
jgi:hypothetical protein